MKTDLWKINEEKLNKTNLFLYSNFIKQNFKIDAGHDFNKIWKWSVDNPEIFWKSIWDFTKVKGFLGKNLLQKSNIFYNNKFFPDSKLNFQLFKRRTFIKVIRSRFNHHLFLMKI